MILYSEIIQLFIIANNNLLEQNYCFIIFEIIDQLFI